MDSKHYNKRNCYLVILCLNFLLFIAYSDHHKPFCPIQNHALQSLCGPYIKNGGVGVSGRCCDLLRQADEVDAGLVYCLCRRANVHKPRTALRIVRACKLFVDYGVDLMCKKKYQGVFTLSCGSTMRLVNTISVVIVHKLLATLTLPMYWLLKR